MIVKVTLQSKEFDTVAEGELRMQDIANAQIITHGDKLYAYVHGESNLRMVVYREVTSVYDLKVWADGKKV